MIIHPKGETPVRHDDVTVSLAYGELTFRAHVAPTLLRGMIGEYGRFITDLAARHKLEDPRTATRMLILRMLIDQRPLADGDIAAMLTAAAAWLAMTSPAGVLFSDDLPPRIHFEITNITDGTRHGQNFRLIFNQADEAPPEWIKDVPSPYGERPANGCAAMQLGNELRR